MARTLGDAATILRDRLDEASARRWTDAMLRRCLNEGAREVTRRAECNRTTSNVTVVASTQSYSAPTDVVRILRAEYYPSSSDLRYPLEYRDYNALDHVWGIHQAITESIPEFYTTWGYAPSLSVVLYPTPSSAGTLKLFYAAYAADLATDGSADSSNLDVPNGWEDSVIDYAEYRAFLMDGQLQHAQLAQQNFEKNLEGVATATTRYVDSPGQFTPDMGWWPAGQLWGDW